MKLKHLIYTTLFVSILPGASILNSKSLAIDNNDGISFPVDVTDKDSLKIKLQALLDGSENQFSTQSDQYAKTVLMTAMILEEAGDNKQSKKLLNNLNFPIKCTYNS